MGREQGMQKMFQWLKYRARFIGGKKGACMKNLLLAIVAMTTMAFTFTAHAEATPPAVEKEVVIGVNDAYIPGGFDSTSDVFVVVNGIFPNGCYRWARAEVTNLDKGVHEVRSIAKVSQGMCLMVLVPFTREVHLGQLSAGLHKIRLVNGDGTYLEKDLTIEE